MFPGVFELIAQEFNRELSWRRSQNNYILISAFLATHALLFCFLKIDLGCQMFHSFSVSYYYLVLPASNQKIVSKNHLPLTPSLFGKGNSKRTIKVNSSGRIGVNFCDHLIDLVGSKLFVQCSQYLAQA